MRKREIAHDCESPIRKANSKSCLRIHAGQCPLQGLMTHFQMRCDEMRAAIAALNAASQSVVLLGDSITEANPLKELHGLPVINEGISGDQIDHADPYIGVRRRVNLVADARPAHVYLLIGINDIGYLDRTVQYIADTYEGMLQALLAAVPQAIVTVQTVLPTSQDRAHLNERVREFNVHIKTFAAIAQCPLLDLHELFVNEIGELSAEFTHDGIHLNPAGYEHWNAALKSLQ
jgi:lysophospholipase L1-like esterase